MLIHIVRYNEKLSDILNNYNITQDELRVNNLHISNLNNIVGGMKLKIPFISSETLQILETTEPFIADYYPSINKVDKIEELQEEKKNEEVLMGEIQEEILKEKEEKIQEEKVSEPINQKKQNVPNHYQNHYYSRRSIYPFYIKKN